jgi:biotin transport system substrate-specific component
MTTVSLSTGRRSARATTLGIVGFAAALAVASQVAVPLPYTPVPITLQPLVVALTGLWLGPTAGAASMLLYLAVGAAGVPVFSPFGAPGVARFFGPTGGYLMAYPIGAFIAGWIGARWPSYLGRVIAASAAIAAVILGGLAHLAVLHGGVGAALALGVHPFVALDLVKAAVAAALAPRRLPRATA